MAPPKRPRQDKVKGDVEGNGAGETTLGANLRDLDQGYGSISPFELEFVESLRKEGLEEEPNHPTDATDWFSDFLANRPASHSPAPDPFLPDLVHKSDLPDPVLDPKRLHTLLSSIGFKYHLGVVSEYLRKDFVFRSSASPYPRLAVLARSYSAEQMKTIQAFAEFLFASLDLEDAFPLFLLVWMSQREYIGHRGPRCLIQCVRSAVRKDDRDIIRVLLEEEIFELPEAFEPSFERLIFRSLACVEMSHIHHIQGHEGQCREWFHMGTSICPFPKELVFRSDKTLQDIERKDPSHFSLVMQSMLLGSSAEYLYSQQDGVGCHHNQNPQRRNLRDSLLALIYLYPRNPSDARDGAVSIRNCLEHAVQILQRPSWNKMYAVFLEKIAQNWQYRSLTSELAVFFNLLMNWSAHPSTTLIPEFRDENAWNGMSTIEIIAVLSFLLMDHINIKTFFPSWTETPSDSVPTGTRHYRNKAFALLQIGDDQLLLGFLTCSVRLNRKEATESLIRSVDSSYKEIIADIFARSYRAELERTDRTDSGKRRSALTEMSANPTLAKSLSTNSTLSSMRRVSRMTQASSIFRWSNRTTTMDDLVERSSVLSVSDGARSVRTSSSRIISQDGEASSAHMSSPDEEDSSEPKTPELKENRAASARPTFGGGDPDISPPLQIHFNASYPDQEPEGYPFQVPKETLQGHLPTPNTRTPANPSPDHRWKVLPANPPQSSEESTPYHPFSYGPSI